MELTTAPLSRADYLRAVGRIVEFLRSAGSSDILVAYGFGCDCPDEQLYVDMPMPADRLLAFMAESEQADFYRVGKDNLHVKDAAGSVEFLFCHETDIHATTVDSELLSRLREMWRAEGFLPTEDRPDGG